MLFFCCVLLIMSMTWASMSCTSCVLMKSGPSSWLMDSRTNVLNCRCCLFLLAVVSGVDLLLVIMPASCILDSVRRLLLGDDFMLDTLTATTFVALFVVVVCDRVDVFDWNERRDLRFGLRLAFFFRPFGVLWVPLLLALRPLVLWWWWVSSFSGS